MTQKKIRLRNMPLAMLLILPFALFYYAMARYEYKLMIIDLNKVFEQGISSGCTCEVDNEDEYDEDENNIVVANDCD